MPGSGRTVGVEEEFLLVDRSTGRPVPRAADVLAAADSPAGTLLHAELLASQVEAATGVCTTLDEVRARLHQGRSALASAAAAHDAHIVATGTPPLPGPPAAISRGERFARIRRLYAGLLADYESCGLHVHVGVPDRDTAIEVINQLRPWLPSLLALSGNSPFNAGVDSGYASWRMVQQARFPGSGVPPAFDSAAAYDTEVARLVNLGVLVDDRMTFWLARPSPHAPTVEVRAADASITPDGAVLQAALSRALVRTALTEIAAGREGPQVDSQVAAAGVWTAARHGLEGSGVDLVAQRTAPATALLEQLLVRVRDALEEVGDLQAVRSSVSRLRRAGTGAERQRRAHAAGPAAVVRMLVAETAPEQAGRWELREDR